MKPSQVTAHLGDRKARESIERIEEQRIRKNVSAAFAAYTAPNVVNADAFIVIDACGLADQEISTFTTEIRDSIATRGSALSPGRPVECYTHHLSPCWPILSTTRYCARSCISRKTGACVDGGRRQDARRSYL
jgi:hypothetical protein